MAMLTSGEYSLCKKNVAQEKKSMVFVKLTDSAQRAWDDYIRNQHLHPHEKPQIEFNGKNEGRILIPSKKNANSDQCVTQFKFDVASNMAMQGTQGSFDCLQLKQSTKQLIKLGQLAHKLRIHANDDVYETTKNRMAAIEKEQRKNCTRQIDMNSSFQLSRRARLEKLNKLSTTSTPSSVKLDEKETKSTPVELSNVVRSKTRSVYNPPLKLNTNVYKMRKPLRERIIQMLALRPHKKNEILAILKQEGVRDIDKPNIEETLNSVSTLHENVYNLAKSAWNDVQEDWLFYTEQEKQIVKKNKLHNLTSPSNSDSGISTSSNQSPSNTPDEKSPPRDYKRPGYTKGRDGLPTKRPRISHYSRQEPAISSTKPLSTSTYDENNALRCDDYLAPSSRRSPSICNQQRSSAAPAPTVSEYAAGGTNNYSTYRKDTPPPIVSSTTEDDDSPSNENCVEDELMEVSSTAPTSSSSFLAKTNHPPQLPLTNKCDSSQFRNLVRREPATQLPLDKREKPKYMGEFVTIQDAQQRRHYKAEFNKVFIEYQQIHAVINKVSQEFQLMGESLRQQKKGTPQYKQIEKEIFKKYYNLKESENFTSAKLRFEYLHEKLSHIKQLVYEYDAKDNAH